MLRTPAITRARRRVARRADALLSALRLVRPRPEREPPVAWAETTTRPPAGPELDAGGGLSREEVQRVLDELVRPALQNDGGDIALVDVRGGEVVVELVGACQSCPSAVLTMKMGVENLLAEELDGFERLVQIDPATAY